LCFFIFSFFLRCACAGAAQLFDRLIALSDLPESILRHQRNLAGEFQVWGAERPGQFSVILRKRLPAVDPEDDTFV